MSIEDDLQLLDQQLDSRLQRLQGLWISDNSVAAQPKLSQDFRESSHRGPTDLQSRTRDTVADQNIPPKCSVTEKKDQGDAIGNTAAHIPHEEQQTCSANNATQKEYQPSVYESYDKTCITKQQSSYEIEKEEHSIPVVENSNKQSVEEDQETKDDPLEQGEEDAIFDEFLDQSTRYRINSLCNKVTHLNGTISVLQSECKRLSTAKKEACSKAQAAETERRTLSKQVLHLQQQSTKLQKTNKQLQDQVQEQNAECQRLRKELSNRQHSESERRSSQSSLQAQLTRAHSENASLREQISTLKNRHKEELDQLRAALGSSSSKVKELERQQRNMSALVKKQDKLIGVLNEQKNNLAAAKTAAGLEEKFLTIITPLQPP